MQGSQAVGQLAPREPLRLMRGLLAARAQCRGTEVQLLAEQILEAGQRVAALLVVLLLTLQAQPPGLRATAQVAVPRWLPLQRVDELHEHTHKPCLCAGSTTSYAP